MWDDQHGQGPRSLARNKQKMRRSLRPNHVFCLGTMFLAYCSMCRRSSQAECHRSIQPVLNRCPESRMRDYTRASWVIPPKNMSGFVWCTPSFWIILMFHRCSMGTDMSFGSKTFGLWELKWTSSPRRAFCVCHPSQVRIIQDTWSMANEKQSDPDESKAKAPPDGLSKGKLAKSKEFKSKVTCFIV